MMKQETSLINDLSAHVSGICIDDPDQLGKMQGIVNRLIKRFPEKSDFTLFTVLTVFSSYLKKLAQKEVRQTLPLETGMVLIRSLVKHHMKNEVFYYDVTDVVKSLDGRYLETLDESARNLLQGYNTGQAKDDDGTMRELTHVLKNLSEKIGLLSPEEIPELSGIIDLLEQMITISRQIDSEILFKVASGCCSYVSRMVDGKTSDSLPLEKALVLLRALVMHIQIKEEFIFDISDVLALLEVPPGPDRISDPPADDSGTDIETENTEPEPEAEGTEAPADLSEEDYQIFCDFVVEAGENLDAIEVDIVELEQDPTDGGIINNIFRPFHTIKGISGFLGLKKMNKLAHITENLLDGARNNEFVFNQEGIDVVLRSVDILKQLLERINQGLADRKMPRDHDIDINGQIKLLKQLPMILTTDPKEPLGQILVKEGVIDEEKLEAALERQAELPVKKIGEVLVEQKLARPSQVASALMNQRAAGTKPVTHVKVDINKLGDLVDFAGELVIAQSMIKQIAGRDAEIQKNIGQLGQIVSKIQNIAMSMRMIPIKSTFMKMIRLVRDLSAKSGKQISLNMVGEDTEIDRNVVDALYEPMVHMIRNSIDHGLETDQQRQGSGKPEQGNIYLRSFQKGGNIVIEIEDDGKGLDTEAILNKAVSKGLVEEDAGLTDKQIFELIMEPGFSTAQTVTDISGRGVGMDVVKSAIEKLRGSLEIDSVKDRYTKFTIRLPLTLAIIDGMLIRIQDERFIIPVAAIQRSFKPDKQQCHTVEGKKEMVSNRDMLIPLIRLDEMCEMPSRHIQPWEGLVVVVESKSEKRGLLIDELLGKGEYVIKTLGGTLENVPGFSGGAILSDGKVGLILDVPGIVELSMQ